jgi:5-methylcytosine-specific restriction endonuclease McrA
MKNYPATRSEAKSLGATHYFTGKPCIRGHIALRKTKGCCIECMKEDWAIDNAKRAQKPKSEASKAAGRRYYAQNKEVVIAKALSRPIEDQRRYKQTYAKNNLEHMRISTLLYKRRHRDATPPWITKEQRAQIKMLYVQARELSKVTGEKYVVDHIIPLRSSAVCGLHVPWNLRVITWQENLKKSNKLIASNPVEQ